MTLSKGINTLRGECRTRLECSGRPAGPDGRTARTDGRPGRTARTDGRPGRTTRLTARTPAQPNGPDGPPNGPDGPPNGPDGPSNGPDAPPNGPAGGAGARRLRTYLTRGG